MQWLFDHTQLNFACFPLTTGTFVNFQQLAEISEIFVTMLGLLIFLNLIMLLRVLQTSYRFQALSKVLVQSRFEFLAYFIHIGIIHMGFSSFYHAYLGVLREEYSTFIHSAGSLVALFLGGGNGFKVGVAAGDDWLSRLMMVGHGLIVPIVMLNFFTAMLVSVIGKVGRELKQLLQDTDSNPTEFDPIDQLKCKVLNFGRNVVLSAKSLKAAVDEMREKLVPKRKKSVYPSIKVTQA